MKKMLLAAVLGGSTAFAWGFVSHVVLPWHLMTVSVFKDDRVVAAALSDQARGSGLYAVPSLPDLSGASGPAAREEFAARSKAGPWALVILDLDGRDESDPRPFVIGFLLCVAVAAVMAGILGLAAERLPSHSARVAVVAAMGVALALRGPMAGWNWMGFPLIDSVVNAVDILVESVLVGLVVAAVVKPPRG